MSNAEVKVGDLVDWRDLKRGHVTRVGRGTLYATFETTSGHRPVNGPFCEFRKHVETTSVRIGQYVIRAPFGEPGKVLVESSGEQMVTEEARLEGWLSKFWNREF